MKSIFAIICSLSAASCCISVAFAASSATTAKTQYVDVAGSRIAYRSIGKGMLQTGNL